LKPGRKKRFRLPKDARDNTRGERQTALPWFRKNRSFLSGEVESKLSNARGEKEKMWWREKGKKGGNCPAYQLEIRVTKKKTTMLCASGFYKDRGRYLCEGGERNGGLRDQEKKLKGGPLFRPQ